MMPPWPMMPMKPTTFAPPLYVGDLDENIHEEYLYDIFQKYGPLHFVRIMRDSGTGKSRGYAFVNFVNPRDAETAKQHAQYEKLGRKHIRIMFKRNVREIPADANIFIKNIDTNATVKDLHEHFKQTTGNIISVKVNTDNEGRNLGYGYVQYEKPEDALDAIKQLNNSKLKEKEIELSIFLPRDKRGTANVKRNIYVRNLPANKTEAELDKIVTDTFTKYGTIESKMLSTTRLQACSRPLSASKIRSLLKRPTLTLKPTRSLFLVPPNLYTSTGTKPKPKGKENSTSNILQEFLRPTST